MIPLEELKEIALFNETCSYSLTVYAWFVDMKNDHKVPCRPECWYHPEYNDDPTQDDCVIYIVGSEYFTHWEWSEYGKSWYCERIY